MTPTHAPTLPPARRTPGDLTQGLAAVLALAGFVLGVPAALLRISPLSLPASWPTWDGVIDTLSRPDDGTLLLAVIGVIAWLAWAAFTVSVITELVAAVRHVTVPRIPLLGGTQRLAATLVTSAGLLLATTAPLTSTAAAGVSAVATAPAQPAEAHHRVPAPVPAAPPAAPVAAPSHHEPASTAHPVITVHRGDTLWDLAERHLGDGHRYTEILTLNHGHPQADGRALDDAHWLYPGWQLRLPHDATNLPAPDATATSDDANPTHTVQRGDTLWDIAAEQLADPTRYPEIVTLNHGVTQPGGGTLTDPDHIEPGWTLALPTPDQSSDGQVPPASSPPAPTPEPPPAEAVPPDDAPTSIPDDAAPNPDDVQSKPDDAEPTPDDAPAPADDGPAPVDDESQDADDADPRHDAPPSRPDDARSGTDDAPPAAVDTPNDAPAPADDESTPVDDESQDADDADPRHDAPPSRPDDARSGTDDAPDAVDSADDASGDTADDADDAGEPVTAPPGLYLGLTALAAAGVIAELARRRRLQQRTRKVGQRIALPPAGSPSHDAERTLREAVPPVSIPALKQGLLNLASRCYTTERDLPRLAAITLAPTGVVLHLTDDDTNPVPPFTATGPRTWTATHDALTGDDPIEDPGRPEPFPALVTLGHTTEGTVLVNLEAAGTLTLTGNPDTAGDVLRALVAELTTCDLTARIGVIADPQFTALAGACEPTRLRIATPQTITAQLTRRTEGVHRALAGVGAEDTLQARSDRVADDVWLPVVYITPTPDPTPPWSGSIVIGPGEPTPGGWSLRDDGTHATLTPLGLTMQPQRLTTSGLATLVDLLTTATPGDSETAGAPALQDDINDAITALPVDITPSTDEPPALRVNVLGPITIDGLPAGDRLSRRSTELLVYLALRGQATGPELDEALWHGLRIDNQTRNSLVYRTRQRLGPDTLPTVDASGVYRLGPDVACDWTDFQHLTRRGLTAGPAGITDLQAALDLVRDRPLLGIPDSAYTWAEHDTQHMISTIADTAHVLARIHAQLGNHRAALTTATKGLLVDNCSTALHHDAIQAAQALGDHTQASRLLTRYETDLAILDPDLA